ncbi:MAG: tetraacyldisaccharide 4'-kinase [Planctomycetota bacterium]
MTKRRVDERLALRGGGVEWLRLPAFLFGGVVALRGELYDRGWLPAARLEAPVVSVGNLSAGGTGKTPAVVDIARRLARRGRRVGLLSRGYRGGAEGNDEARLLASLLPDVPHVADADRVRGGWQLIDAGADVIVLDDGFQHRRLARDLDLVLIDALRPWGLAGAGAEPVRALLPRGLLRETPAALARADAIIVTRADRVTPDELAALESELSALAPGVPVLTASHRPVALRTPAGARSDVGALAGRTVELVSGIGNPEGFEATVRSLGARIAGHRRFPDHHAFVSGDLDGLGRDERWVVVTAKDAVKLRGERVHVLEIEFTILSGEAILEAQLESLRAARHIERLDALHEGLHG